MNSDDEESIYIWLNSSKEPWDIRGNNGSGIEEGVPRLIKYLVMTSYLATFLFGIFGNTLVMVVIFRFPKIRSRSVTNYYIWNLSLADELFVLTLPFFCYATFTKTWIFGDVACRLAYTFRECNKFASLWTLMVISADRLLASFHNLGRYRQIHVGVTACVVIWVLCLAGSTPYLLYGGTVPAAADRVGCHMNWPSIGVWEAWIYLQLIFGFLLPLCAVAVFNVLLLRRLTVLGGLMVATTRPGSTRPKPSSMARMVLTVVSIFVVCQVPYHVVEIISIEVAKSGKLPDTGKTTAFIYFNAFAQVLVFLSSCCNPIIYGIFNKNYRKLYKEAVLCSFLEVRSSDAATDIRLTSKLQMKRNPEQETSPLPVTLHCCYSSRKDALTIQYQSTVVASCKPMRTSLSNCSL